MSTRKNGNLCENDRIFAELQFLPRCQKEFHKTCLFYFIFCWLHAMTKRAKFEIQKMAYFGTLLDREYQFEKIF